MTKGIVKLELTEELANSLEMYLLISTQYRCGEARTCRELSTEFNEGGSLCYPNMASNADWWDKTNENIQQVLEILK